MHSHDHVREVHAGRKRAKEMSKTFKRGGRAHEDEAEDKKLFGKMIKKHDHEMKAEGKKSGGRLDKFARGGRAKGGHKTNINIVVAPHGRHPADGGAPPASPLPGGGGPLAGGPPPGGPMGMPPGGPPGGPPIGGAPGLPPGMPPPQPGMKRGGVAKRFMRGGNVKGMTGGAESGVGRLEKAKAAKRK